MSKLPPDAAGPVWSHLETLRTEKGKVVVQAKAIGSTPHLQQDRFTIDGTKRFADLVNHLKMRLRLDTLYVYCNDGAFEPSPDEYMGDLSRCFGTQNNNLTLSYCKEQAFG
mmetsp:Transcript_63593/g.113168  ORF Transcript_63593/g.113168 Transcript_63593/m.113168 type:complete len:111 (-) Transcript_63593:282-614(-)|eukprot:CAMPEP_0197651480 /NCGR_PEP_ID=MMETSP1338-20131121/32732_1 /TAXON_ID=43686 ORGANISM="Pelagodinium beii, Strain RCC1491" /NCGR_SAMPLE_ID=MMETSP1338 /ASSEMBLY_ACC=CAM_ASM_000754 /LENGTH=110 /DNA_ID=CAMNT_0043226123 /DNA_START=73 /DNA_END=405 /DNA_ORIENTATION=-